MQRISTETDGVFRNGVRGVQRGTKFNAEWCNAVQEEIAGFIESAGLQLDVNDNGQLVAALLAMLLNPSGVNIKKIIAIGTGGNSTLTNTGLSVATENGKTEVKNDGVEISLGQKTAKITAEVVQNNIVLLINDILKLASNLNVLGKLRAEGNVEIVGNETVGGSLNVAGAVSSSSGFFGGIAGGNGDIANFPLIRADQISPRTNGSPINVNGTLVGAFSGTLSGFLNGSWIPGDNAYFKRSVSTIYPVAEMASLPDGAVAVFYNKPSEASYVISWRDMDYTQRVKTVDAGTPFVFMKKKNSQNQDCGMLLCIGEVGGTP